MRFMSNQPLPPPKPVKIRKSVLVGVLVTVSVVLVIFAVVLMPLLNRPRPDIVLTNGHDGFQGLNYVIYVDVKVKNNGGEGWVTVYAELSGGGRYEEQNQRIYLASGETRQLQFVFDVTVWNALFSSMSYSAWAVVG